MIKDTGGSAFPTHESRFPDGVLNQEATYGMTLRDYFAAKAMQGLLSDTAVMSTPDEFAFNSYMMADAMLKAREQ